MGLDLNILPQYSQSADFSHDIISFSREGRLFELIRYAEKVYGIDVQIDKFTSYLGDPDPEDEDSGRRYGHTNTTPYGETIKGIYAKHLKEEIKGYKSDSWKNRAIIAFLNELPDGLIVWLYWN